MNQSIMDIATRSRSPSIDKKLLLVLLNEANAEVREAHKNAKGVALKNKEYGGEIVSVGGGSQRGGQYAFTQYRRKRQPN